MPTPPLNRCAVAMVGEAHGEWLPLLLLQQPEQRQVAGWGSGQTTGNDYALAACGGTAGLLGALSSSTESQEQRPAGPPPPPSWQQPGHVRRRRRKGNGSSAQPATPRESRPIGLRGIGSTDRRHSMARLLWTLTLGRYARDAGLYWTPIARSLLELFLDIDYTSLYLAGTEVDAELLAHFLRGVIVDLEMPADEDGQMSSGSTTRQPPRTIILSVDSAGTPDNWEDMDDDGDAGGSGGGIGDAIAGPLHYSTISHLDLRGCRQLMPLRTARLLIQHVPLLRTLRIGGCFESGNTSVKLSHPTTPTNVAGNETIMINPHAITCLQRLATGLIELRMLDLSESTYVNLLALQAIFHLKPQTAKNGSDRGKHAEWPRLHTVILTGCPAVDHVGRVLRANVHDEPASNVLPATIQKLLQQRPQLSLIV
ncbi:hypothetical protein SYNPS1DRAFT_29104 [Syncephalis pseudoplumigaleata]|uniref:Uncharacterized protein n=1 Tax=Syncephalis pseudoplumigaleata TaxID=1712513 RepID=A0A4P9Z0D3_9FUNG|nr:hypothetical protein SYNPS1DRAFT_29104 [Syncephalis pseudoplumigaleata]|eukprot:RKP25151.1 hypothetical protein SYNPS1DRAFT_29104 [Syncephalis pseudoplumigaleata]